MKLAQMERMATSLDRTARAPVRWWNARRLNRRWGRGVITSWDIARDMSLIAGLEVPSWKPWMERIRASGVPVAVAGGLAGFENPVNPVTVNQATVTGGATELVLVPTALLPIVQNVQSGKVYELFVSGTSTTAATPGTYTLASRIGPAPTNASPLFGAVSGNFTPIASATAAQWCLNGFVVIRGSGTANTAVGSFVWNQSATIGGGGPSSTAAVFTGGIIGGISASFDSTGSTVALWIGVTHATSTTNTWVPQAVTWASWN